MTVVLDTHALLWLLDRPDQLGPDARRLVVGADRLLVSAITAWELGTLVRRGRIALSLGVRDWLRAAISAEPRLEVRPVDAEIALTAAALDDGFPGDPADRLIYATAVVHACPLASKDARMTAFAPDRVSW